MNFLSTKEPVYHMEMDLKTPGQLIFSEGHSVKITDGITTTILAGDPTESGLMDGCGSNVRFNKVTGFAQLNKKRIIVVDSMNNCLRTLNRVTGCVKYHVGQCGKSGFQVGDNLLFSSPWSVLNAGRIFGRLLLLTDRLNKAIRIVALKWDEKNDNFSFETSTDNRTGLVTMSPVYGIALTTSNFTATTDIILTEEHSVNFFNGSDLIFPDESTLYQSSVIAGRSGESGFVDGSFAQARFSYPNDILPMFDSLNRLSIIFVADTNNNAVRILNYIDRSVHSICSGTYGSMRGPPNLCQLKRPTSLLLSNNYLYVGTKDSIRRIHVLTSKPCTT